jgi:hypothetical protein
MLKRLLRAGARQSGQGAFLQYDGASLVASSTAESMQWNIGHEPLDLSKTYLVACNGFLFSGLDQGIAFFNLENPSIKKLEEGRDWRKLVIETMQEHPELLQP